VAAWAFLVTVWATAVGMPVVLVASLVMSRWRIAGACIALYLLPHVVDVPASGLMRDPLYAGFKRWFGPPGLCRLIDYSEENTDLQLKPEPSVDPVPETRRQLFCMHPHGIYSFGVFQLLEKRSEMKVLSAPFLYHFSPLFRLTGKLLLGIKHGSAGRRDLSKTMKSGESPLLLVPGGFHEATLVCPVHERVFLRNRRGFVKYALRYGYDLVPCYTIGESDLMANPQGGWGWRFFLNSLSLPAVLPWGYSFMPLLPFRGVQLVTVVGPPLSMPHIPNPTDADVAKHHQRYVDALLKLYERAAVGSASSSRPLEIW